MVFVSREAVILYGARRWGSPAAHRHPTWMAAV